MFQFYLFSDVSSVMTLITNILSKPQFQIVKILIFTSITLFMKP